MKADSTRPNVSYNGYERLTIRYGVEITGWPFPPVRNPGNISGTDSLRVLASALMDGTCHWITIPADELKSREEAFGKKLRLGVVPRRKVRSDFGLSKLQARLQDVAGVSKKKRGRPCSSSTRAEKRRKISSEFISLGEDSNSSLEEDSGEDEEGNDDE